MKNDYICLKLNILKGFLNELMVVINGCWKKNRKVYYVLLFIFILLYMCMYIYIILYFIY